MNMENITDIITTGSGYVDTAVVGGTAVATWFASRFAWWKAQTKGIKVAYAVALFIAIALTASVLTAPFT